MHNIALKRDGRYRDSQLAYVRLPDQKKDKAMGESREREGVFGKYTEHFDDDRNKIGESREREGVFGKYTEQTDAHGNTTGESREREGVFGSCTEHTGHGWHGGAKESTSISTSNLGSSASSSSSSTRSMLDEFMDNVPGWRYMLSEQ